MKNKGCAFEIKGSGTSRYFASPAVTGFADFVRFLYENRGDAGHAPRPIHKRMPQVTLLSEADWQNIANEIESGYTCILIIDIAENQVWVNEDTGAGMAIYCFPFLAVMEAAASGAVDPWKTLLERYPSAKMRG